MSVHFDIKTRSRQELTASVRAFLEVGSTKATASALIYKFHQHLIGPIGRWFELTHELVLPDGRVDRSSGGGVKS